MSKKPKLAETALLFCRVPSKIEQRTKITSNSSRGERQHTKMKPAKIKPCLVCYMYTSCHFSSRGKRSFVHRPFTPPVLIVYSMQKDCKTGGVDGLGMKLGMQL